MLIFIPERLWVHVHDASDEALHDAELAVDANHDEHEEEDDSPDTAASHLEDDLGVGDEHEARATIDHVLHRHPLVVSHVAEDTEGDHPGQKTRPGVHEAGDNSVLIMSSYSNFVSQHYFSIITLMQLW